MSTIIERMKEIALREFGTDDLESVPLGAREILEKEAGEDGYHQ